MSRPTPALADTTADVVGLDHTVSGPADADLETSEGEPQQAYRWVADEARSHLLVNGEIVSAISGELELDLANCTTGGSCSGSLVNGLLFGSDVFVPGDVVVDADYRVEEGVLEVAPVTRCHEQMLYFDASTNTPGMSTIDFSQANLVFELSADIVRLDDDHHEQQRSTIVEQVRSNQAAVGKMHWNDMRLELRLPVYGDPQFSSVIVLSLRGEGMAPVADSEVAPCVAQGGPMAEEATAVSRLPPQTQTDQAYRQHCRPPGANRISAVFALLLGVLFVRWRWRLRRREVANCPMEAAM